jgi:pimeloyl-ACP methyl ester carboxylesterase
MLNIDASRIVYEGVSEGGNLAQAFLAYAPEVRAAAIIAGGERLTEVLIHQDRTDPTGTGSSFFFEEIPKFVPNVTPTDVWTGLSVFQMRFDPQDPQNHARFIYRDPIEVAGTTDKASILVVEGIHDNYVPNNATDSLAWLLGIPQLPPVARRVPLLAVEDAPATANIGPQTTAGMVQYVPAGVPDLPPSPGCESDFEGHFCAQSSFVAVEQRQDFYRSAVNDPVPTIPPPDLP